MNGINKKQLAIALKYVREEMDAPKILAKGYGDIAKKIVELARQNNIPIESDKHLAEILSTVEANNTIPIEAFAAVAGILSRIYEIDSRAT